MTNEKARDFFSAYYEGSLEPGLCVSLEQRLKADEQLRHEYDAFVETLDHLGTLKFEDIAIPDDLNERISARLDRHIYESKRGTKASWTFWLRNLTLAGAAAAVLVGAIFTLQNRGSVSTASVIPTSSQASDRITYALSADGVEVHYAPASPKTVVIVDEQGNERRGVAGDAAHPELFSLLANDRPAATIFQIKGANDAFGSYLAIPGRAKTTVNSGEGTLLDFVKAVADYYRLPVSLKVAKPQMRITWTFTSPNSVEDAGKALKAVDPAYQVTLLQSDVLQIEQN